MVPPNFSARGHPFCPQRGADGLLRDCLRLIILPNARSQGILLCRPIEKLLGSPHSNHKAFKKQRLSGSAFFWIDQVTPIQVAALQTLNQNLGSGNIGGKRNILPVAQTGNLQNILLIT